MHFETRWSKTELSIILKDVALTSASLRMIEDYLCNENLHFSSPKELARKDKRSEAEMQTVIKQYFNILKTDQSKKQIIDRILDNVYSVMQRFKGPIAFESWMDATLQEYGWDEITALRYLQFAKMMENKIHIDAENAIFWDTEDTCRICQIMFFGIQNEANELVKDWERIQNQCAAYKCPTKPEASVDQGMLYYHGFGESQYKVKKKIATNPPKMEPNAKITQRYVQESSIDFEGFMARYELNPRNKKTLDFINKNQEGVSDAKLRSFGKINRINTGAAIMEINDTVFPVIHENLIKMDDREMKWYVDSLVISHLLEANTCDENGAYDSFSENIDSDIHTIESENAIKTCEEGHSASQLIDFFISGIQNARTSYKFYWADALVFYAKRKLKIINNRDMASALCFLALDDVLNKKYLYINEDYIPIIIKKHKKNIAEVRESFNVFNEFFGPILTDYDINRLTLAPKQYFLNIKSVMNGRNWASNFNQSHIYVAHREHIELTENFCACANEYSTQIEEHIRTIKHAYLSKKKSR